MLIRPYNAVGVLAAPLSRRANAAEVNLALAQVLGLGPGDWCYLCIHSGAKYEIVRVHAVHDHVLGVTRAQDNTEAHDFPAGAEVYYTLTAAEVRDGVEPINFDLFAYEGLTYVGGIVDYQQILIEWVGVNYTIGGGAELAIGREENAYGCCDGNNDPAPIGNPVFLVTSRPYPIQNTEEWEAAAAIAALGMSEQVFSTEKLESTAIIRFGTMQSLLIRVTAPPEYLESSAVILEGSMGGALVPFTAPPEYLESSAIIVEGTLAAKLIVYTHPAEKLQSNVTILGGVLT